MRLPASLVNCFKVFSVLVAGYIHPDIIIIIGCSSDLVSQAIPYPSPRVWLARLVMTVCCTAEVIWFTVCSLLVVMLYMFTFFQGNHHWIMSCNCFVLHTLGGHMELCLQCLSTAVRDWVSFDISKTTDMEEQALGTSHRTSESNVKLQPGVWRNWYQLWLFLSASIASWCLELYCQADELLKEDWHISVSGTVTTDWVDCQRGEQFYYCYLCFGNVFMMKSVVALHF